MNLPEDFAGGLEPERFDVSDQWIVSRLQQVIRDVTDNMEKFELGLAAQKVYDFIWSEYCDWYIEMAKSRLYGEDAAEKKTACQVLRYVLINALKLLHPFMPFITEEIWQSIPHEGESLMVAKWPEFHEALNFAAEEREFERIMTAIRAIRNRRAEMNVPPSKKAKVYVETPFGETFEAAGVFFTRLAFASEVAVNTGFDGEGAVSIVTSDAKVFIPLGELVDFAAERARLNKELAAAQKNLSGIEAKLANEAFTSKAPKHIVDNQRDLAKELKEKIAMLEQSIERIPQ